MWKCFALAISNLSPLCSTMLFAVMFSQFLALEYLILKHAFETVDLFASDLAINNTYKVTPGNFFKIAIPTNPQLFSKFRNV